MEGSWRHMKATGIVRKIDQLGRIVLPIELRRLLDINVKDDLEIFVENEEIYLSKYQPKCTICGGDQDLKEFKGKMICSDCIELLGKE